MTGRLGQCPATAAERATRPHTAVARRALAASISFPQNSVKGVRWVGGPSPPAPGHTGIAVRRRLSPTPIGLAAVAARPHGTAQHPQAGPRDGRRVHACQPRPSDGPLPAPEQKPPPSPLPAKAPPPSASPSNLDRPWVPASAVDRQAAAAVGTLLAADAARRGGRALKSLTLAPRNVAKRATHAVTVETLRHASLLQAALDAASAGHARLPHPVALVLAYEVLLGQGLRPVGPA